MSKEGSCVGSGPDMNKNIRRATIGDIDELTEICRICFPNVLIWCNNRCARKWWEYVIRSKSHEIWAYQFDNKIVALNRLVLDTNSHEMAAIQEYKEIRNLKPGLGTLLCVLIVRPRLLFEKIVEKINRLCSVSVSYSDSSSRNSLANTESIWFHSIAVLPNMRGKGIGASMIRFCEQRVVELGFDSVKCLIKTNNNNSIKFHERMGFIRTEKSKDHYMYVKLLSKNHNNEKVFSKVQ